MGTEYVSNMFSNNMKQLICMAIWQQNLTVSCLSIIKNIRISVILNNKCTFLYVSYTACTVWVKKKFPPEVLWHFFPNGWDFLVQILVLHAYYAFLSMLDYKILLSYLQLWRSYAILSPTIQFTSYAQNVHHRPKCMLAFSDIFPKQLGIFSSNFTRLLYVPIYAKLQIFIQLLSLTVMKLCHIKCDHPACVSADGGHFEDMMVVALNMA